MNGKNSKQSRHSILKPGIANSPKGKKSASNILQAAKWILIHKGYPHFTTRNIADQANMRVSNVYYYFPGKIDLLRSLIQDIVDHYSQDLEQRVNNNSNAEEQFINLINFLLMETKHPENRRFFTQLWALLTSDEDLSREFLEEFFTSYRNRIYKIIEPLCPDCDPLERNRRAAIIASLMEGLLVMLGSGIHQDTDLRGIEKDIKKLTLKIAKGNT